MIHVQYIYIVQCLHHLIFAIIRCLQNKYITNYRNFLLYYQKNLKLKLFKLTKHVIAYASQYETSEDF